MSDMHSFNVSVAEQVGVNAAILLQTIKWWCEKNKANDRHEHDGLYWTYNSIKAWQELYPYLGKSAITSALRKLEERGLIVIGNFNRSAYDRTKWYAITEKGLALFGQSISENRKMEGSESENGNGENREPIPDTNQLHLDVADNTTEVSEIIDYLNDKAGTRYRASTAKTREHVRARIREGYTLDDFKRVIDVKVADWLGDDKMQRYLCPDTLFGSKFEKYLNQPQSKKEKGGYGFDPAKYNYF